MSQSPGRREDARLLRGEGIFTADYTPEGLLHLVFVRSPYAHARVGAIDTSAAAAVPGVVAIWTVADLAREKLPALTAAVDLKRPDGSPAAATPRPLLAADKVRHIGEPVALVVAESLQAGIDAAEQVTVDYEALQATTTARAAQEAGAAAVWDQVPDNIAFRWQHGDRDGVAQAIAGAAHVTRLRFGISRVAASPMEPRITLAEPGPDGRIVVLASSQNPYQIRDGLAKLFGHAPGTIRVVARDVGGSFGMKAGLSREEALVYWAAWKLKRPARWMSDRSEAFLSDDQARDVAFDAALALDAQGTFQALQVRYDVNIGAYLSGRSMGPITNIGGVAGVYRTPLIAAEVYGVLTNTVPTSPYRGAGRPDATFLIERLIDLAAGELGIDAFELRRRNLIPAQAMPYKTGLLFEYDCGDFRANMDLAAKNADLLGFPARKSASAARGRLRGLGICNPIEVAGGPYNKVGPDQARLEVRPDGMVHLYTGAMSVGQGLETAWAQMASARLGIPVDRFVYHQGDTDDLTHGRGSGGSAGLCVSGTAIAQAIEATIDAGRALAANHLETAVADIEYAAGAFTIAGTDRSVSLAALAQVAIDAKPSEQGLTGAAHFQPPRVTFPNGCHICEVEVDPETGVVEVQSYTVVEDIGRVLNRTLAHGQIHGGVAQGMGQALGEEVRYDAETGQLLTGSFMDYAMPRASDIPPIRIEMREVPTKVNALGAKGVGEAGTVGSIAATINAICNALAPLGVKHIDMPATPDRVWAAIQAAAKR